MCLRCKAADESLFLHPSVLLERLSFNMTCVMHIHKSHAMYMHMCYIHIILVCLFLTSLGNFPYLTLVSMLALKKTAGVVKNSGIICTFYWTKVSFNLFVAVLSICVHVVVLLLLQFLLHSQLSPSRLSGLYEQSSRRCIQSPLCKRNQRLVCTYT